MAQNYEEWHQKPKRKQPSQIYFSAKWKMQWLIYNVFSECHMILLCQYVCTSTSYEPKCAICICAISDKINSFHLKFINLDFHSFQRTSKKIKTGQRISGFCQVTVQFFISHLVNAPLIKNWLQQYLQLANLGGGRNKHKSKLKAFKLFGICLNYFLPQDLTCFLSYMPNLKPIEEWRLCTTINCAYTGNSIKFCLIL